MIPKTKKLFISYRSSDAAKVDKIAVDLSLLKYDDGTPCYTTWQDKYNLPPASPNWWDAIVDAIIDCDVFVFNISKASLQSEVCLAELNYAHRRNRPIMPIVLDGEFFLDPRSGKYDITYWDLLPQWSKDIQFLFYVGADFYNRFQEGIELFERDWPRDIKIPRPINPDNKSVHSTNHAVYAAGCDYAERLAFTDAEKHFIALVSRNDSDYKDAAASWLEILALYAELIEIDEKNSAPFIFRSKWEVYEASLPKDFLTSIFDPKNLKQKYLESKYQNNTQCTSDFETKAHNDFVEEKKTRDSTAIDSPKSFSLPSWDYAFKNLLKIDSFSIISFFIYVPLWLDWLRTSTTDRNYSGTAGPIDGSLIILFFCLSMYVGGRLGESMLGTNSGKSTKAYKLILIYGVGSILCSFFMLLATFKTITYYYTKVR